ncbi:transposase [Streptomyces fradiae]|uniref:Transposase n=1 Tax=Streptomyces fradiae TaxID=1906 RepID=A0ACC4WI05_STRFR|nr:transposase [Streptomyces fradiae]OFA59617.1 transposase [Streptomyces fradiae]
MQLTGAEWEFIGPYLPIGEYGPYPERLRQQFEGVIWRFKTGGQWWEMPAEFGAWSTVHNRFRQWRDAGVFEALMDEDVLTALEKAAAEAEKARSKGATATNKPDRRPKAAASGKSDGASGAVANPG